MSAADEYSDDDEPLPGKRHKAPNNEIDVAPLIDVSFLLLMFFMVQQAMNPRPDADVPKAKHGTATDKKTSMVISIKNIKGLKQPKIVLGDGKGPEGSFATIPAFVQSGLKLQKSDVIVQADRDTPHGFVQQVIKAVNKVEGARVSIAVQDAK